MVDPYKCGKRVAGLRSRIPMDGFSGTAGWLWVLYFQMANVFTVTHLIGWRLIVFCTCGFKLCLFNAKFSVHVMR